MTLEYIPTTTNQTPSTPPKNCSGSKLIGKRHNRGHEEILSTLGDHKLGHGEHLALVVRVEPASGVGVALSDDGVEAGGLEFQEGEAMEVISWLQRFGEEGRRTWRC